MMTRSLFKLPVDITARMSLSQLSRLFLSRLIEPLSFGYFVMPSLMLVVTSVLSRSDALTSNGLATKSNRLIVMSPGLYK